MKNTKDTNKINDSKRQTGVLIGIAMIILAAVFAYFAVSLPSVDGNSHNVGTTGNSASSSQNSAIETPTVEIPATENVQHTESPVIPSPTQAPATVPDVPKTTEAKTTSPTIVVQYPLNLNTCTAAELMTINGIGEARASAIIAYREYLGGYTDVEQLKNISGIGDGIFAKIEPYVTV